VLAIAITILVLDCPSPTRTSPTCGEDPRQWPSYLRHDFLTIGGIWLSHHSLFGRLRPSIRIMQLNLLLLMVVSFLPSRQS
jgi:uncharacterized membrane protein